MERISENYRIDGEDGEKIVERMKAVSNFEMFQGNDQFCSVTIIYNTCKLQHNFI